MKKLPGPKKRELKEEKLKEKKEVEEQKIMINECVNQ